MNLGLDMSLKLQQKLSFQMIQSLKLLQVNTLQLEQLLKTELEMNPVLEASDELEQEADEAMEREERETAEEKDKEEEELDINEDSIDWEEYLEEGFDLGYSYNEEVDRNEERYEPTPVYQETLEEHLTKQLAEKKIDEKRLVLVQFLIGSLDNDGYLRISLEDIAEYIGISVYEVEEARNVLIGLDPPGVGAQNLQECMILQLRARKLHNSLAMKIIAETWDLFEKLKIPEISRHFNVEPRKIQESLEILKILNPKPGYQYNPDKPSTIIPDLIVEKIDGTFVAMLNDRSVPSLHINKSYANMIKRGSTAKREVKKYIREKFNSATWFIRSIEQRKTTMLKVMYAIIERQMDFFEKGPPNLHPLKLQDVADMVEMHISTVSRVTSNKYVQTRHGIFELKYFFTEAVGRDQDGSDISSERIKNRIRQLVNTENRKKPLSDQKISNILSTENLPVARRTVAKYREQMRILPARLRQKYE
ncbi:RNA polymerase factor sigma-54 [Chitinispirillales bacterium ANBcel5]|uniref:RNA polymerase factor sigma-54 n=1 Tax=Cellulosispirillum alkaliphilum TaxID=3039283 RepID=UPI002A52F91C|nr:RNA polymerase factor sigma-54 [Chitinispirillales bacterium ANBcel5]